MSGKVSLRQTLLVFWQMDNNSRGKYLKEKYFLSKVMRLANKKKENLKIVIC